MARHAPQRDPRPLLFRRLLYIGLCVVVVFTVMSRIAARGRVEARTLTVERMVRVQDALDRYAMDNAATLPTTSQGLRALLEPPTEPPVPRNWRGPYLEDHRDIFDGWGRRFHYVVPGGAPGPRPYDLWSLGSDNAEGGVGSAADIKSWEAETLNP